MILKNTIPLYMLVIMKVKLLNLFFQYGLSTILFFMVYLSKKIPFLNLIFIFRYNGNLSTKSRIKRLFRTIV